MHIKNLTSSPYSLINSAGGKVMLPAHGSVDIEPHPMHISYYRQAGYFEITESVETEPPVDPRDALREEYAELSGESASKRWSESRLRAEVDALLDL